MGPTCQAAWPDGRLLVGCLTGRLRLVVIKWLYRSLGWKKELNQSNPKTSSLKTCGGKIFFGLPNCGKCFGWKMMRRGIRREK